MYEFPKDQINNSEKAILRKLRVWIVALAVACLVVGVGIGAMMTGRPAVAQNELQNAALAPEALSASFAEISKRVEPAVVAAPSTTPRPAAPSTAPPPASPASRMSSIGTTVAGTSM